MPELRGAEGDRGVVVEAWRARYRGRLLFADGAACGLAAGAGYWWLALGLLAGFLTSDAILDRLYRLSRSR